MWQFIAAYTIYILVATVLMGELTKWLTQDKYVPIKIPRPRYLKSWYLNHPYNPQRRAKDIVKGRR